MYRLDSLGYNETSRKTKHGFPLNFCFSINKKQYTNDYAFSFFEYFMCVIYMSTKSNSEKNISHYVDYDAFIIDVDNISSEPKPLRTCHMRRKSLSEKIISKIKNDTQKINVITPIIHVPPCANHPQIISAIVSNNNCVNKKQ